MSSKAIALLDDADSSDNVSIVWTILEAESTSDKNRCSRLTAADAIDGAASLFASDDAFIFSKDS